jgi:hypothetical protein
MQKKFTSDIDMDFANRDQALALIQHVPASQWRDGQLVKHNTGVYVTEAPVDSVLGICGLDYETAEDLGYVKLDFLNVSVYQQVKNPQHLQQLLNTAPDWKKLEDHDFFTQVVHIGNHWDLYRKLKEPLDSIARMSMFLALIRPAKRHLANSKWSEISKTIWDKPTDGSYAYKRSHATSYAHLVVVHMNLLCEQNSV